MKNICILTAITVAAVSTPAFADSKPRWVGTQGYVGIIGGWDKIRVNVTGTDLGDSRDGFVYGGVAGVQTRIASDGIIGIEGEVTGSTTKLEESGFVSGIGPVSAKLTAGRDLFIGARSGFIPTRNMLLYVKGGYTNARISGSVTDGITTISDSKNFSGYRVGGGVEVSMRRWRLRTEYRFSDYGKLTYEGIDLGATGHRHQVVAGVLYAF